MVDRAVRSNEPPAYRRAPTGSKHDAFKDENQRLLEADRKMPGHRIRELIAPLGCEGGKSRSSMTTFAQARRGWVVVACLGCSRAGAGALIFTEQTPDLLAGMRRCLWSLGALPQTLVWDRHLRPRRQPERRVRRVLPAAARRLAVLLAR
jgi:hypothetical protein